MTFDQPAVQPRSFRQTSRARLLLVLAAGLLSACQSRPAAERNPSPPTLATPPPAPATGAAPDSAAAPTAAKPRPPFTGYRRYVGTVGRLPVLLELTIDSAFLFSATKPLQCEGGYCYERYGQRLMLKAVNFQPEKPLELAETADNGTNHWQARQPAGPYLSGTWSSADGRRRLPFELREDYTDAVRYEYLTEHATGAVCPYYADEPNMAQGNRATLERTFLHLLGPDTLLPALRRLQCPPPARRRRLTRQELSDCDTNSSFFGIGFNAYGLLGLEEGKEDFGIGAAHPNHESHSFVYDLHAGRRLETTDLLRPDAEPALRRLISRHLLTDDNFAESRQPRPQFWNDDDSTMAPLPRSGLMLLGDGLWAQYEDRELPGTFQNGLLLSWRELLPLVPPGSPLNRLLRVRGLRPKR